MLIKKDKLRGVAALITVISLGSLVFIISLSTAVVTFWSIKNIDANQKGMVTYYAAYSGIQDALIKLERNKDFSGEYSLSINDTDDVSIIVSNTGESVTIYSEAVSGQIYKRIETTADIDITTGLIVPVKTEEVVASAVSSWTCGETVTFTYKGQQVTYGTAESQGECWLDRNLGASRVAMAYNDSEAYGDLFQWGRLDDGHQERDSGTTTTLSGTDDPGHNFFIIAADYPNDWRDPQNSNRWQGVNGINNPCPNGWRIPTKDEWEVELNSWGSKNCYGAYASSLKLTTGGLRDIYQGLIVVGISGLYWSSSLHNNVYSTMLAFDCSSATNDDHYYIGSGFSVRCIKD